MSQHRAQISILLLTGLFSAILPSLELSHSHEGGRSPHSHEPERPGTHHSPSKLLRIRHDEFHGHPHDHADSLPRLAFPGHLHEHAADQSEKSEGSLSDTDDPSDRHSHVYWFGGLLGHGLSTESDNESLGATSITESWLSFRTAQDSGIGSYFLRSATIWIQGPPWQRRLDHSVSKAFCRSRERSFPPLCDIARHERTGVLVI